MEIRNKAISFRGRFWYLASFIVVSAAFLLVDITEILPSFAGTKITIYSITLVLFMFAVYAKERHNEHGTRSKWTSKKN